MTGHFLVNTATTDCASSPCSYVHVSPDRVTGNQLRMPEDYWGSRGALASPDQPLQPRWELNTMRLRHPDGTVVHVAYCTDMHAAATVDGGIGQLSRYAEPVRERLGLDRLGLGLWLAADVIEVLCENPVALRRLRTELATRGLDVVTLNAFPYGTFHQPVVKKAMYLPDWTDPRRLAYTLSCARVLTELLPDNAVWGSVSTVPLAWRTPWTPAKSTAAHHALDSLADGLAELHWATGRRIRVGLEPEPGCVIETTDQAIAELSTVDNEWIGVCLDACHLAVAFEHPATAVDRLAAAYVPIVKTQASCALHADDPVAAMATLAGYAEPRYLHQTRAFANGHRLDADDLPDALAGGLPADHPWRVHFHVPPHAQPAPPLRTTATVLTDTFAALFGPGGAKTDVVEVATYTWSVVPGSPTVQTDLIAGIAGELAWTRDRLVAIGLKTEEPA